MLEDEEGEGGRKGKIQPPTWFLVVVFLAEVQIRNLRASGGNLWECGGASGIYLLTEDDYRRVALQTFFFGSKFKNRNNRNFNADVFFD